MRRLRDSLSILIDAMGRFRADTSGNIAIIFAVTLPILIGGAGLGVETSYWYYRSLELQSAADAAAYAGELEKIAGSKAVAIESAATDSATSNGFESATGTIAVHTPAEARCV